MNKANITGLAIGVFIILSATTLLLIDVSFFNIKIYYFVMGIAVVIIGFPFFINLLLEAQREANVNQMFLEFARDLVEGVKSGTSIGKSIINVRAKDYGMLNPHISKLANQIMLGIPVRIALETFSKEVNSSVIRRAIGLIKEAETSGGRIESILESVTFSVSQIEKLKKERMAAVYNLTVQGYIIFFIFIVIMLVMRFKILTIMPQFNTEADAAADLGDIGMGINMGGGVGLSVEDFAKPFLFLLLSQGLFAGLVIGKMAEGSVKAGIKHSFVLVAVAWIISTGAELIFA